MHAVRDPHVGPIAGPGYSTWSDALAASFADIAADLDATDLRKVTDLVDQHRAGFDEPPNPVSCRAISGRFTMTLPAGELVRHSGENRRRHVNGTTGGDD